MQHSALQLTRELIQMRSINPPGEEEHCARLLAGILEEAGFEVALREFADARTSVVARLDGSGDHAPICLTGHLDTVPLGATP